MNHWMTHQPFRRAPDSATTDVMVAIVDHFEPADRNGETQAGLDVSRWCQRYAEMVAGHYDSGGVRPQHTWFYRFEYLNPCCLRPISKAAFDGFGEMEFHLHHGFDTEETFSRKLSDGLALANQYGAMVSAAAQPRQQFAYIAGNWSLDNGSRDPAKSGCNTELRALNQAGCFADFTFPAIGSAAQPKKTNAVYYATDCPRPKSYNTGIDVQVGGTARGDLMIVQGPSLIDWQQGSVESAAIESFDVPRRSA